MAVGEKRLFSLINATVSHEMRNPTNSIQTQANQQLKLNKKFSEIIRNMKSQTLEISKQKLEKNLAR